MNIGPKSHAPITLSGSGTYLTLTNQEITVDPIDISEDTNLTATQPIVITGDDIGFNFAQTLTRISYRA